MRKIRSNKKKKWYDWFINHITKSTRKDVNGFKDKIVNLFKTNTTNETVYGRVKKLSKSRKEKIEKPFIS